MSGDTLRPPELCRFCYWRLSGCVPDEDMPDCDWYEPAGYDDDWEPPGEKEYDPGPNADAWGRAGFTVICICDEEGDD